MECLDTTEKKQLTSIAFPSLGTGNLGYPVDKVAKQMFSCVENFSKSNSDIKEVLLVVYEKDHKSIQVSNSNCSVIENHCRSSRSLILLLNKKDGILFVVGCEIYR